MTKQTFNSHEIVDQLASLYDEAVVALNASLLRYMKEGVPPDGEARASGAFCYPELVLHYDPDGPPPPISRAFGKLSEAGTYVSTVTQPELYRSFLVEQLDLLLSEYPLRVEVRRSASELSLIHI